MATTPSAEIATQVQPGMLLRASGPTVTYRQRFVHSGAGLQFLDCGEWDLPPRTASRMERVPGRESLLFLWRGSATVELGGSQFALSSHDTLYVPLDAEFRIRNDSYEAARLFQTSAPAGNVHPVFHSQFSDFRQRPERIRRLKGKIVYLMFDVGEAADRLVAGYTFFEPHARSWPPHNHTDQEECYIFLKGHGSMEVYESPETLTFVHNVNEGDIVTIPMLNYHPVFSQDEPLEFIWCIAGERYWVGDKHQSFLKGEGASLTT